MTVTEQQVVEPMARTRRNDEAVKIDSETVRQGRIVAAIRGISLAQLFSELLAEPVRQLYAAAIKKEAADVDAPRPQQPPPKSRASRKPSS